MIADPKFAFRIFTQGVIGTEAFAVSVNGEEVSAHLSDFAEVPVINAKATSRERDPAPASPDSPGVPSGTISLKSQSGVETKGALIVKLPWAPSTGWGLVARLPEMADTTLVLVAANMTLTRVAGNEGKQVPRVNDPPHIAPTSAADEAKGVEPQAAPASVSGDPSATALVAYLDHLPTEHSLVFIVGMSTEWALSRTSPGLVARSRTPLLTRTT